MLIEYDAQENGCYQYGLHMPARDGYVSLRQIWRMGRRSPSDCVWIVPGTHDQYSLDV